MSSGDIIKPLSSSDQLTSDERNPTEDSRTLAEPKTSENRYWDQLVQYNNGLGKDELLYPEFAALQRLNTIHLHNILAEIKAEIWQKRTTSEAQMVKLKETMHDYVTAIRDTEYMSNLSRVPPSITMNHRIFLEHGFPSIANRDGAPYDTNYLSLLHKIPLARDAVREFLRKYLHKRLSWSTTEQSARRTDFYKNSLPETYSPFVDWLARFIIAVGGGAALIVPMLIMSIDAGKVKSLVTVSVAVILFALSVSLGFKIDNKDTLTATATYAAVLVVFVGTNNT
ncbi:uncharacterized protein EAE98_011367 [Botrytis deweyae]|uniref:DUF6594 domain-containing protein n=1 Tax=Botrytis deweyae TaxID=2478750 RepID=A0ABQ7I6E2_9HELO|nr:uncharacterized protein EAE98_011367 [Botrytis deweyae]KAF7915044.1 hypothetical protein EAE98_011367 [Botrytis deweyae]